MSWKLARDPFYRNLPASMVVGAGFFEDSSTENVVLADTLHIMSAPLNFIKQRLREGSRPVVIVGTGCFAPVHEGHIGMMKAAREELLVQGFTDVFGFMSPDHDEYIQTKLKDGSYLIDERIALIRDAIYKSGCSEWLRIDTYAGLFAKTSINFTDVIYRMEEYLKRHLGTDIPVLLVVGGDNARFALAFQTKGGCIIVDRPPYGEQAKKYSARVVDNKRVFYANLNCGASSTEERKLSPRKFPSRRKACVRVDEGNPVEWTVVQLLKDWFDEIRVVSTLEQYKANRSILSQANTISLDPLLAATYNLRISRQYDYMGMDKLGYAGAPEADSLESQIACIPKGSYQLFDDDSFTGGAMRYVTELLNRKGITVLSTHTATQTREDEEVLDARDFLIGTYGGGLVIDEGVARRRPYILPYVNPSVRASVRDSRAFSIAIWAFNAQFYPNRAKYCQSQIALLS